jgi:protein SCO1
MNNETTEKAKSPSQSIKKSWILLALALGIVTGWAFNMEKNNMASSHQYQAMTPYHTAKKIQPFALTDHNGKTFTEKNLLGKWHILFTGYTQCPDVCPTAMSLLSTLFKQLSPQQQDKINVLFLSVDPYRDTSEALAEYIPYYHKKFIGLTAGLRELIPLSAQLGLPFLPAAPSKELANYPVNHSGSFLLINPLGEIFGILPTPQHLENILKDIQYIFKNFEY